MSQNTHRIACHPSANSFKSQLDRFFSPVVAAFVVVSVQDLRPNSQNISAFYLENIYQLLADPDLLRPANPHKIAKPLPFSPPVYAVWVNTLWFLSLVISLTCAMLATSLQLWTRRYIRITQLFLFYLIVAMWPCQWRYSHLPVLSPISLLLNLRSPCYVSKKTINREIEFNLWFMPHAMC